MNRRSFVSAVLGAIPIVGIVSRLVPARESEYTIAAPGQTLVITTYTNGSVSCRKGNVELPCQSDRGWLVFGDKSNGCRMRRIGPNQIDIDWFAMCDFYPSLDC